MKKSSLFLIACIIYFMPPCFAQPQKIVADKIVAQVEDKIILSSEYEDYKNQDLDKRPLPECDWLEAQIIQKALTILAENKPLLNEVELNLQLDNQIRYFISQYGGQKELEDAAGKKIYQIKEEIRIPFAERTLENEMREKILERVNVTPAEVKYFLDKIPKDSVLYAEGKIEISQLILYPKANMDEEQRVVKQLLAWKQQVESGQKKFDALARLYSQDPGSSDQGGLYAISKHDKQWDSTWFAAVWKLKDGEVSPVVKSAFGFHIIQMVKRTGDDAVIRQILLIPTVGQAEINNAKAKLDTVREKIISGTMTFSKAAATYSEDEKRKYAGCTLTNERTGSVFFTIDELDKEMGKCIKGMKQGDISVPQAYKDDQQRYAVRIIFLKSKTEAHIANLKEDYEEIAKQVLEIKQEQALKAWVKEHIADYYLKVDSAFSNCDNLCMLSEVANTSF